MKPIEAGCLAIVVNDKKCPQNLGKVVTVLYGTEKKTLASFKMDGNEYDGIIQTAGWIVEGDVILSLTLTCLSTGEVTVLQGPTKLLTYSPNREGDAFFLPENLMRIDGGDEDLFKKEDQDIILKEILKTEHSFNQ